jgi:type IV pilus assembly protein PilN
MFKNLFKKKPPKDNSVVPDQSKEGIESKKAKGFFEKIKAKLTPLLNNKLGKSAIQGEEILGVEITNKEIRLAQVSTNNSNQWILDKFYIHPTNLPEDSSVLDHLDALGSELQLAIQRSKITTTNAFVVVILDL